GNIVKRDTVTDVINFILSLPNDTQVTILCPVQPHNNRSLKEELAVLMQKGFVRVEYQGKLWRIESMLEDSSVADGAPKAEDNLRIVVDRVTKNNEDETVSRLGDSIQTAFFEGKGDCFVRYQEEGAENETERFFCD